MKNGGISADPPATISLGAARRSCAATHISPRHVTRILDSIGREMASAGLGARLLRQTMWLTAMKLIPSHFGLLRIRFASWPE
jgi:hypothetical protein